jgi:hypothetical protein
MIPDKRLGVPVLFALLVAACGWLGDSSTSDYQVPDMPGPSTIVDGTVVVSPLELDDYLSNPGIGWQHRPGSSEISGFPETVLYSNRRPIGWKFLNPLEGVYDWTLLDAQLNSAVEQGKQFSFRVYTMVGEGYDGHMVPSWVIEKGAVILESGEPDYSNCVYQDEWARFVEVMAERYDGNTDIAFIDISGYGNFGEWSWRDDQTEWDEVWEDNYPLGTASPEDFQTIDGQARRRLADMFLGGANDAHQCRATDGAITSVSYEYRGFQETQLIMPYAGIAQSTQYVYSRRTDVGFRYDCLGRPDSRVFEKVGGEILGIWETAPVVFELCGSEEFDLDIARESIRYAHASIVHDNEWNLSSEDLENMMMNVGYRYFLKEASIRFWNRMLEIRMQWQNLGNAPSYSKMGQKFVVNFYLLDHRGAKVASAFVDADVSSWMPASTPEEEAMTYELFQEIRISPYLPRGEYYAGVSMIDLRTGFPINLAIGGRDSNGINILSRIEIK